MTQQPHFVVLTGAGMSAESGIPTFRGEQGLWRGYRPEQVASPEAWQRDPQLVLDFYNWRRTAVRTARPNRGHEILVELEDSFQVTIVTQNVDDLHERAGSRQVVHLHGEIIKARSTCDSSWIEELDRDELHLGDCCPRGGQLRPHIVWFGEAVPMIEVAAEICGQADLFAIVGTSLAVYPAAGLIHCVPENTPKYVIDPQLPDTRGLQCVTEIAAPATAGLAKLQELLQDLND